MINVLLIEDNQLVRQALSMALEDAGMKVIEAEDGTVIYDQPGLIADVDVIVTDILMPNEDGMAVLAHLADKRPELPVIAVSGGGRISSKDYLEAAEGLGAVAVFQKPLDEQALIEKIQSVTGKA